MIKICIIGCEGHYDPVLEAAVKHPEAYEIAGIAPGSAEEDIAPLAQELRAIGLFCTVYDAYDVMLNAVKPDVAVVCPPFYLNAEVSLYALQRSIHVYCEKPLATTWRDYLLLEAAVRASDAQITTMLTYRYDPVFRAAHEAVRSGEIGTVRMLQAQKSYKLGCRPSFYRNRLTYGGTLPWVGIHAIDWIAWLSGERFQSVYANHSSWENSGHGELEAIAAAQFTMSNHCLATMTCDFYRPEAADTHGDDRVRVVGTKGIVEIIGRTATCLNHRGIVTLQPEQPMNGFEDFVRFTKGRSHPRLTPEASLYATKAALLALQSADTHSAVKFDEA